MCVDGGFSGASLNRPAIQKVISDAEKHLINKVVVYKLDRISRSQKDTLYLIEEVFLKNNVDFVSMTETLDTSTPFGMAMIGILSVFAQLERETIKERMALGLDARVKSGKYTGQKNDVIGYNYENGVLTQNEYDASIVRKIYRDFANGKSQSRIVIELNQMQWRGHKWDGSKVRRILTQPLYIGMQTWKGETYAVDNCPCIITPELYEAVQKEIARRSGERGHKTNHNTLLGGMIWCGKCGKRYRPVRCEYKGKVYYRYYCYSTNSHRLGLPDDNCHNRGWGEEELNSIIIGKVNDLRVSFDDRSKIAEEKSNYIAEELKALRSRIEMIERQNEKLVELYSLGAIDAPTIAKRAEQIKKEKASLEAQIEELKKPVSTITAEDARSKLERFSDIVDADNTESIKTILQQLIKTITLDGDNISIVWNFEA